MDTRFGIYSWAAIVFIFFGLKWNIMGLTGIGILFAVSCLCELYLFTMGED